MFGIYHKYIARYKLPFCISILCVACEAACDLLGPTIMARVINEGIAAKAVSSVFHWGGMMLLIALAGAAFAISRSVLSSKISQRIGADLRHDLFQKIVHFSEPSADRLQGGSLITRMTNDTTQVTQFINGMMRIFIKAPITCVGSIVLASLLNLRLSLVVYASVAVVAVLLTISMKLSYRRFAKLQSAMDRLNSVVQEYLLGVRLVKAFGAYDEEARRFSQANTSLMKRGVSAQLVITLISPMISLTIGIGTVLILALGGRLFTLGQARPGDISAFVIYMSQILSSLLMITNIFNTFVRTKASTARIQEVLDAQNDFSPQGVVEKLSGAVAFEDVTFAYPTGSQVPALSKLSFCVRPGESLAVIGSTGSGKSTLCWLLLRFYDVNEGRILLDGRDIRTLDINTVRQNVAIVPQKAMLFSGTVAQSIRWGDPNASDEAVRSAANRAQASFVEQMPKGYDSLLASAGVNLSGGQKQRLSIARGFLKNAPILLLDDATSALDSITETKVRTALTTLAKEHTVITVTQRCTTAMYADHILVLENGERVGFGTHRELLESCEIYREIYHSQVDSGKEATLRA